MSEKRRSKRLPYYERAQVPPPVELTTRDKQIFETIYQYEGVLADYQLERLFFHSHRRMQGRMSLLFHAGYLNRFTRQQQAMYGFMAYFLDEKALNYLAAAQGVERKALQARGRDERTALIPHDVKLNDVRITIMQALQHLPQVQFVTWINSRTFWAQHDTVEYTDTNQRKRKRYIRPDGYFHVMSPGVESPRHSRFLLELDMRTEHNARFVVEKVLPGLAYIRSEVYRERFGANAGRWLVVTTGERRLANMIVAAEKVGRVAKAFYFTTFDLATMPGAFFTQPIWYRPTFIEPTALFMSPSADG